MSTSIFTDPVLVHVGPVPVTESMLTAALTSAGVLAASAFFARAVRAEPGSWSAAAARLLHGFLRDLAREAAGRDEPLLETFAGTLFIFIAASACVGQLPSVIAPTANLAATSALAALVFLAVPVAGIRARGLFGYFAHYFRPNPVLFPLHVISELSRTLALSLRLFGNMLSGHLVVALIVALVGAVLPVPLMALDLLIGLLQAYIFSILACVYVGAAMRVGEE